MNPFPNLYLMNKLSYFLLGFFLVPQVYGQDDIPLSNAPEKSTNELSITGFSYPLFMNGETHSEFSVAYPISEKFDTELQGFYDTYILADVTRFSFRGKYYASEKFYSFAGMAAELERNKTNGTPSPPRLIILSGVGYDFNNKLNLELKHEMMMDKTKPGLYGIPSLFSAHGKFKF